MAHRQRKGHLLLGRGLGLALAPAALAGGCIFGSAHKDNPWAAQVIPLAKGATWTYRATLTHYDDTLYKETTSTIEWTTTVVDVIKGDGVTAYVMKGWPTDLVGATGDKPVPTERVLLKSDDGFLWGKDKAASVDHAEGWFAMPLQDGQKVCPDPQLTYCWEVAEKEKGYQLDYHAGAQEETYMLEPGQGVTRYENNHAGTTDRVVAVLEKFEPGSDVPAGSDDSAK